MFHDPAFSRSTPPSRARRLRGATGRTILFVTGSDRISFLNAFCTNNVKALQPGSGCEAFITSPQGKRWGTC
jgi:folate-binding Fe-S cluster repair protein YgfZ